MILRAYEICNDVNRVRTMPSLSLEYEGTLSALGNNIEHLQLSRLIVDINVDSIQWRYRLSRHIVWQAIVTTITWSI